jgi:hypothetical protein
MLETMMKISRFLLGAPSPSSSMFDTASPSHAGCMPMDTM